MGQLPPAVQQRADALRRELDALLEESRTDIPAEMQAAQSVGPVRENAALYLAASRAHYLQGRIENLRQRLHILSSLDLTRIPCDKAGYGSVVELEDDETGEKRSITLCTPEETSLQSGSCSLNSPLGRVLLGKRSGDIVDVDAPSGLRTYRVIGLKTLHELIPDL